MEMGICAGPQHETKPRDETSQFRPGLHKYALPLANAEQTNI
jgi:hypothetical protein